MSATEKAIGVMKNVLTFSETLERIQKQMSELQGDIAKLSQKPCRSLRARRAPRRVHRGRGRGVEAPPASQMMRARLRGKPLENPWKKHDNIPL